MAGTDSGADQEGWAVKDAAGVGRAPPLWAWLAVGFGVDGVGLAGLFQLVVRIPHDDVFLQLLSPASSLLFVAWMSQVIIVPALLRAPGPKTTPEVFEALLLGGSYVPFALVVGCVVGGVIFLELPWFATTTMPQSWFSRLNTMPSIYVGSAAGGAVAGAMAHIWRKFVRGHSKATWRCRSDVVGGALAAGLSAIGLSIPELFYSPVPTGAWGPRFVVEVIFPLVGTLALMPHLVMLGLDLRRAANQSHQPTPNCKSS